jgi:hypothetical protein
MVGAISALALSIFSIVKRSPRRCKALPPTATIKRSASTGAAEYVRDRVSPTAGIRAPCETTRRERKVGIIFAVFSLNMAVYANDEQRTITVRYGRLVFVTLLHCWILRGCDVTVSY